VAVTVVSSGAIAAGCGQLGLRKRPTDVSALQAVAAVGQRRLMTRFHEAMAPHGIEVAQLLLTREDFDQRERYLNIRNCVSTLQGMGCLPIVNENDTVAVEEIRYGDNDHLAALVAGMMRAEALLILTDIDGLYARDPAAAPDQAVVGLVRETDEDLFAAAGPSRSGVGSGGMASKVEAARTVGRLGIAAVIANAKVKGIVGRVMAGEELGTLFTPSSRTLAERKYWMAFGGEPRGSVKVDEGARKALEDRGRSLLPSGVIEVRGDFKKGELIAVLSPRGREIARGLCHYSAPDLARIKGRQSSEIEAILGAKLYDEVIHRDYLVLTRKK